MKKLIGIVDEMECCYGSNKNCPKYYQRRETIRKILTQQSMKFYEGKRSKDAIVSIDKPYIRPIVRGKENKTVEFGSKLHKLQIDGISFIKHVSFEAFHEGNRLTKIIWKAQKLTSKKVKIVGREVFSSKVNSTD